MMKIIIIIPLLASMLSGCIFSGDQSKILTGKDGKVLGGRNQNDGYVGGKEADARAIEALSDAISKPTSEAIVTFDEDGEPVFTCKSNISGAILAANLDKILAIMSRSTVPKTGFAQGMQATGEAVIGLLQTPAAIVGLTGAAVGYTAAEIAKGVGDQNGDITKISVIGDGTATGPTISGDTIMQPEVLPVE